MSSRAIVSNKFIEKQRKPPKRLSNYKKAVKLEEGLVLAKFRAENRWKNSKKGFAQSLKNHIGKMIDRIDPLEATAILIGTYAVHQVLISGTELTQRWNTLMQLGKVPSWLQTGIEVFLPYMRLIGYAVPSELVQAKTFSQEFYEWGFSFFLAFVIVKYGGELMGLLGKGISAIGLMFLT